MTLELPRVASNDDPGSPVGVARAAFVCLPYAFETIFGDELRREIERRVGPSLDPLEAKDFVALPDSALAGIEFLLGGWGMPVLDEALLRRLPRLRAVFYGAGSVRPFVTEAFWRRDLPLTSAASANAIPTAEFAAGAILLSLKRAWAYQRRARAGRDFPERALPVPGGFGSRIGLVGYGRVARRVRKILETVDSTFLVHDPRLGAAEAAKERVVPVSLTELFSRSDVVSLHLPLTPQTRGLIGRDLLARLPHGATLINTARGAVVVSDDLHAFLAERPDIEAVLDVTDPEPLPEDSPCYDLPNVFFTPHVAGAMGHECRRMGRLVLDELERFLEGAPLQHRMTREAAAAET